MNRRGKPIGTGLALGISLLWAQGNFGIGTTTPTERLHVEGNLRLQGAFMPNNQPGTSGNLLLSAGAGAPPTWLPNGTNDQVLTIVGGTPQWANNNAICGTPTSNRFTKISGTSPAQVCNTSLAENTNNQIWNAGDGPTAPLAGDKFSIYATATNIYALSAYTNQANGTALWGDASGNISVGVVGVGPTSGAAVAGFISTNLIQPNAAGSFRNDAANGIGVVGVVTAPGSTAVVGFANGSSQLYPAAGSFVNQGAGQTALVGDCIICSSGVGVYGKVFGGASYGVYGDAAGGSAVGVYGKVSGGGSIGVRGYASGGAAVGVWGEAVGASAIAIHAQGNFTATGTKSFYIDHPLDPENKLLLHFSAEGPEPYNLYRGLVTTDADGRAFVQLPAYFEAINKDFSYYLQPIGTFAQAIVEKEVQNNQFVIRTDKPYVKVSWMLLAKRNDLYVQKYGQPTEIEKPAEHRGKYLMPQLYGKDKSFAIYSTSSPKVPQATQVKPVSISKMPKK